MIFEQQALTASQLQEIERTVQNLKLNFTDLMLKKKPFIRERDVHDMFEDKSDSVIHDDVVKNMKMVK